MASSNPFVCFERADFASAVDPKARKDKELRESGDSGGEGNEYVELQLPTSPPTIVTLPLPSRAVETLSMGGGKCQDNSEKHGDEDGDDSDGDVGDEGEDGGAGEGERTRLGYVTVMLESDPKNNWGKEC